MEKIEQLRELFQELMETCDKNQSALSQQVKTELIQTSLSSIIKIIKPCLRMMGAEARARFIPILVKSEVALKEL